MVKKSLSDTVKEYLYDYIKTVDTEKSCKLPPETTIAEQLSVSRVTVRRALDDLEKEGVIIRIHGKGTFINEMSKQINLNLNPGHEFFKLIHGSGYQASVKMVKFEIVPCDKKMAEHLEIEEGEDVIVTEKIFYANNHPAIICIDTIPCRIFPREITREDLEESTFDVCRNLGGKICVRDRMEISSLSREQTSKFAISSELMECDSILSFDVINYDENNVPVFFDKDFYNTTYIRFNMIRSKNVYYD